MEAQLAAWHAADRTALLAALRATLTPADIARLGEGLPRLSSEISIGVLRFCTGGRTHATADELDRMAHELASDPSPEALTAAATRHAAAMCRTPVSRATVAMQDTLHTYFRLHPEIELSLKQGLVGSTIRTSAAVARDCVPEVWRARRR